MRPVDHMCYKQSSLVKEPEKSFMSTFVFIGLISKNYLVTVPQLIIKSTHLEINKFSGIDRLFKSDATFEIF